MLTSLKKWVKDVAIDLTPPLSQSSSSSSMAETIQTKFHSIIPLYQRQESRDSSLSLPVYSSRLISMDSFQSIQRDSLTIPPQSTSPVELDLSHLNQDEQEHITNVLRRARAIDEQQLNSLSTTAPILMSPTISRKSSISSTSTASNFNNEHEEKHANNVDQSNTGKSIVTSESILTPVYLCQICNAEHQENSTLCFQCQENELINNNEELIPINDSLSLTCNNQTKNDEIYDNMVIIDSKSTRQDLSTKSTNHENQAIISTVSRNSNRIEIDESEFFYEEPSPYIIVMESNEQIKSSYHVDEYIDEDDNHERDHVKELEETIANLSRHIPFEHTKQNSLSSPTNLSINTDLILEMEIESPSTDEISSSNYSIYVPMLNNNNRIHSSNRRDNLTDPVVPTRTKSQRISSMNNKCMSPINRQRRNLPPVPTVNTTNRFHLRRANSESRFNLSSIPLTTQENLDDDNDLLEIDLNHPIDSMNITSNSTIQSELNMMNEYSIDNFSLLTTKQLRDQTTNTSPTSCFNSSIKSTKKLKRKSSSFNNTHNQINHSTHSSITKLQKSTSTEIIYPFPVTKLILNPSRHDLSTDIGFHITGGHSIPNCIEVTACIENINIHHRNYELFKNIIQEGDEVLELAGVPLRGKSSLYVENLMNKIQSEFEILVRSRSIDIMNTNIQRCHSMNTKKLSSIEIPNDNNQILKSKSTTISSLRHTSKITIDNSKQQQITNLTLPNDSDLNRTNNNSMTHNRQNSNESDENKNLSKHFSSSQHQKPTSENTTMYLEPNQSAIISTNEIVNTSNRSCDFLKSDLKQSSKESMNIERKSSPLSFTSLKFLRKKTKSVDYLNQKTTLVNRLREKQYVGDIELQIRHDSELEQLVVRINRAKNLIPKDTNGFSDPFVKVYLLPGRDQENKRRTKHVSKTLNPVWNHVMIYENVYREELQYKKLEFTVWDYDRFISNDFLGQVIIDLKNQNVIDDKPHWYRLQALRSREEITNRSSAPHLHKMTSVDSATSSKITNILGRFNQTK